MPWPLTYANLWRMNTYDIAEQEAASVLVDHALQLVKTYVYHPEDIDAAMAGVFIVALEEILQKRIYIEKIYA